MNNAQYMIARLGAALADLPEAGRTQSAVMTATFDMARNGDPAAIQLLRMTDNAAASIARVLYHAPNVAHWLIQLPAPKIHAYGGRRSRKSITCASHFEGVA